MTASSVSPVSAGSDNALTSVQKSATSFVTKGYGLAFVLITSLFFMWAIAHNMNDILIKQFQKALDLSRGQSGFIQFAFYMGYFFMALPAGIVMKRFGYKAGILFGLVLYAIGALLFYPAAEVQSYLFFLAALFIIASGLTFLETAANPYVTVMGCPERGAQRLNLAQSFNGLGAASAPLIGGVFIFSGIEYSAEELAAMAPEVITQYRTMEAKAVQLPYLAIACVVTIIALLIFVTRLPHISTSSEPSAANVSGSGAMALFKERYLRFAVIAQFFYVGAQVCIWSFFIDFCLDVVPTVSEKEAASYLSISLLSFMVGRFIGTALMQLFSPEKMLALYSIACFGLCGLAIFSTGWLAIGALGLTSVFMSIMFPTIFALGIKGLGERTELGSSLIIMSIIGGALFPPVMGFIADTGDIQFSIVVPMVCFVFIFLFAKAKAPVSQSY